MDRNLAGKMNRNWEIALKLEESDFSGGFGEVKKHVLNSPMTRIPSLIMNLGCLYLNISLCC